MSSGCPLCLHGTCPPPHTHILPSPWARNLPLNCPAPDIIICSVTGSSSFCSYTECAPYLPLSHEYLPTSFSDTPELGTPLSMVREADAFLGFFEDSYIKKKMPTTPLSLKAIYNQDKLEKTMRKEREIALVMKDARCTSAIKRLVSL